MLVNDKTCVADFSVSLGIESDGERVSAQRLRQSTFETL